MEEQQPWWAGGLGRPIALAERFAAEGQMNLNKLVEAAVYSAVRRAGWRYRPEITRELMLVELEVVLQGPAQAELAPELITALERGRRMLAEGRAGDLLSEEAPDVFVCRTCGHAALGSPPDHCPDCEAWPGRFRRFTAIFNADNAEPADPRDVLALLARNAQELARLVAGLSEEELRRPPPIGDWSIREHIAHFYDTQELLDTRIGLMLEHDDPDLTPVAVYELATEQDRHPASTSAMLADFVERRARCVALLETLPLTDLWRTGRHPEFGRLTVLRQSAYMAYHEQAHLPEIEALCAQIVNTE